LTEKKAGIDPAKPMTFQEFERFMRPEAPPWAPRKRMEADFYRPYRVWGGERNRFKSHVQKVLKHNLRRRLAKGDRLLYNGVKYRKPENIPANVVRLSVKRWERLVRLAHLTFER
jgi:hypothetical protein